ncbi:MAG: S8 family serine peptidase [Prevotella sp.]
MKIKLITTMLLCATLQVQAQQALDLLSRAKLRELRLQLKNKDNKEFMQKSSLLKGVSATPTTNVFSMIKLSEGATAQDLQAEGVNVLRCRHGFAFANIPLNDVERVANLKSISRMSFGNELYPMMRNARVVTGVDKIHQGIGLSQAYTGKGIVCGVVDTGIDPNHVNFQDENGNPRVKQFSKLVIDDYGNLSDNIYTDQDVISVSTDNMNSYHGTHTMGIMAGGYKGNLTVATPDKTTGTATVADQPNPYYGVAYGSEIAAAGSVSLAEPVIAYGVEDILTYAWGNGENEPDKRCVLNLSLGANLGSHDGKDVLNQYFDLVMQQDNPIIVLSSGNEGDMNVAVRKTLSGDDLTAQTFIKGYDIPDNSGTSIEYYNMRYGGAQVWSNLAEPFDIKLVILNNARNKNAAIYTVDDTNRETGQYWISSSSWQEDNSDVIDTETLGKYFNGYIGILGALDEASGRYYYNIDFQLTDDQTNNADKKYTLGIVVTGKDGEQIDMYCNSASLMTQFTNYSDYLGTAMDGWEPGSADGSINNLACGKSTIVVGSYNTSDVWGSINGYIYSNAGYEFPEGEMSFFTSYGTMRDGTTRPHICAPGAVICSSSNRYFIHTQEEITAQKTGLIRNDNWVALQGTSQAAPHVAGAIAMWLEADPTLTRDEVLDIIQQTAIRDSHVENANQTQWGAGKFDAYEGLKEVLRRATGIKAANADDQKLVLEPTGDRSFRAFLAGANELRTNVYRTDGTKVASMVYTGDEATINLSAMPKGSYIINVNGRMSKCVIVK